MKAHLGIAAIMAIALFAPRIAIGQELTSRFAFVSPIVLPSGEPPVAWGGGGGVEWWVGKGTNIGGEIETVYVPAYTVRRGCCVQVSGKSWVGFLFSLNGTHYLARSTNGPIWEPFLTGGIGALAAAGAEGVYLGNVKFGGGVDRWLTPHRGIRFEVQDQLTWTMLVGFRVGVIFR